MQSSFANHGPERNVSMLQDIEKGATEEDVARAQQIPCPKMLILVDDLVMLVLIIVLGRPIPPQHEPTMLPQSRHIPRQEVTTAVSIANTS